MRSLMIIGLALIAFNVNALSIQAGVKAPAMLGMNITGNAGTWTGFFYGGGLAVDIDYLTLTKDMSLSGEAWGMFTLDRYALPPDLFVPGAYQQYYSIRWGVLAKFHFFRHAYAGIGPTFVTHMAGTYGDADTERAFIAANLGTDAFLTAAGGYAFPVFGAFTIPVEIQFDWGPGITGAVPISCSINAGFAYVFKL
ncbi:MAG: hypothetical protein HZC28_00110 [Spirochaetes bacterium]|nr:hypothetical protein [Spirochaetota bacterium]